MAKQNTTPKQSAGGGYIFENEVVAYFLTHLLVGRSPIEHLAGLIEGIEVQRPAEIWHLDDLILTLESRGKAYRVAFSIKSNPQFDTNGFPEDFIREAWEQFLQHSSTEFEPEKDRLGLITSPLDEDYRKDVYDLLSRAREQAPQNLAMEFELERRANDRMRSLFQSAGCPPELADEYGVTENDIGRLLGRIVWMPCDFEGQPSSRRKQAKHLCQNALASGSPDKAEVLWETFCSIADDLRTAAGSIDREELVGRIRPRFDLTEFPDHRADWEQLNRIAQETLEQIPNTIGGEVELQRREERRAIADGFEKTSTLGLIGASGTGKTIIARAEAVETLEEGRVLWFDSERLREGSMIEWESTHGLSHTLEELIRANPTEKGLLVLDELDQLYDESGFATAAQLIEVIAPEAPASPWQLLITCQPEDWKRIREELLKFGAPVQRIERVTIEGPSPEELSDVWDTFPSLQPLQSRRHLTPVLLRPKILDLLARRSEVEMDLSVVGESDLVQWFWENEITDPESGYSRAAVATELATRQADNLRTSISVSSLSEVFEASNLDILEDLESDRIIVREAGNVAFEHELYGEWARFQCLRSKLREGRLASFLGERLELPMWHRPLRLLGVSLLEQNGDTDQWEATFETVGKGLQDERAIAQDLLLESVAFVTKSDSFLDDLWTLLTENDGGLLDRLMKRLLFSATIPDPRLQSAVDESEPDLELYAAATTRIPYWPYWNRILDLLHEYRNEIPYRTRGSVARAAELWLRYTPLDFPFREEAAELAVTLGDWVLREKESQNSLFWESEPDQAVYRAVLSAGHEEPDRVSQIVLEAAGRRERRFLPPPLSDEEKEALRKKTPSPFPSTGAPPGPPPSPWPDGPAFRVDESLQTVVFEEGALIPLVESQPAVAREVLLGLLIQEPKRRSSSRHRRTRIDWLELEMPQWHPPFYTRGPFRAFLATNDEEGVEAILRLVHHATARWVESRTDKPIQEPITDLVDTDAPRINVHFEDRTKEYIGNAQVFSWYRQNADSSGVIASALMALEKYLYDRIDAEEEVEPVIDRLLEESNSLAIVGLLTAVGRKHPILFRGALRHLLTTPELLLWTLGEGMSEQLALSSNIGFPLIPEPQREAYQEWHQLKHRQTSLREWACFLYLNDPKLETMFEEARERWREELEEGGRYAEWDAVKNLVALFDRSNYAEQTSEDGQPYLQYTPPEDLQDRAEEVREETQIQALLLGTPSKCRRLLDGKESVDGDTFDELWNHVERLQEEKIPDDHEDFLSLIDIQCGVAAVMICRGAEWLDHHPDKREWAEDTILSTAETADLQGEAYESHPDRNHRSFTAEALPILWSEDPLNPRLRKAVTRFAVEADSEVAKKMVISAKPLRDSLGDDYTRLLRVIQKRSRWIEEYREVERKARGPIVGDLDPEVEERVDDRLQDLSEEREVLRQNFIDQTIDPDLLRIRDLLPPIESRRQISNHSGRKYPALDLDEGLLIAAYSGLPIDSDERSSDSWDWNEHWLHAIRDTISPLTPPESEPLRDIRQAPSPWSRFVVESAALLVLETNSPSQAQEFWEPILNLGPAFSNLTSWFLREWTSYSLLRTAQPEVVESWQNMISYALDHPQWSFREDRARFSRGEVWRALLGFLHLKRDIWSSDLCPFVQTIKPQLQSWTESHLHRPRNAKKFAAFLTMPAANPIITDGIIWIASAAESRGERFWEDDTDDRVVSLLVHAWQEAEDRLRSQEEAFSAFNDLLGKLTARQLPVALELSERVSGRSKS